MSGVRRSFVWNELSDDVQVCVLRALFHSLVGHHWPECLTGEAVRKRQLEIACLSKQFARQMKLVFALYTFPWEPQYSATAFVDSYLLYVFSGLHGWRIATTNNFTFLYTAVYTACTAKPTYNRAEDYYRLLGHRLTALLRKGELEWKGLAAVKKEMRFVTITCKYIDRFHVKRYGLSKVVTRLKKAYLAGNPKNTKEPKYTDPPLVMKDHYVA